MARPTLFFSRTASSGNCWCDSHVTKKTSMRCAAWNTVITMLLLGVWVEVRRWRWRRWRVWEVEVGREEERERRDGA